MFRLGLIEEVQQLLHRYGKAEPHRSAGPLGYREVLEYLAGRYPARKRKKGSSAILWQLRADR